MSNKGKNNLYIIVIFACLVYTAIFFFLNIARYQALYSSIYHSDAAQNQIAWNTAHGKMFYQTVCGGGAKWLGHFQPIYLLISVLYKLYSHIYSWYLLVSFLYAFSGLFIFLLAKQELNNSRKGFLIFLSYLFYAPLHYVNFSSYDPVMLTLPFFVITFYFFKQKRFWLFLTFIFLALACKADASLPVFMFGVYALFKKRSKRWSLVPFFLGLAWFFISVYLLFPIVGPSGGMTTIIERLCRSTFTGVFEFIFFHPVQALELMFSREHLICLYRLFKPFLFIPFISWEILLALPSLFEILLVEGGLNECQSYYLSPIVAFSSIALIYGYKKIDKFIQTLSKFSQRQKHITSFFCLIMILANSIFSNWDNNILGKGFENAEDAYKPILDKVGSAVNMFDKRFYSIDARTRMVWALIKQIPAEASVAASGNFLTQLSNREILLEFAAENTYGGISNYNYWQVDYMLIDKTYIYSSFPPRYTEAETKKYNRKLKELFTRVRAGKWDILYDQYGLVLLRKR